MKLILRILLIGGLFALLSFLFHPHTGNLHITLNGDELTSPISQTAAIPLFMGIFCFALLLAVIAFLGAGTLVLIIFIFFGFVGLSVMAPFLLPFMFVALLVYVALSD